MAALLELADLSNIEPSLSAAAFDDDCLALVIVELNDDWKSGVTLLNELLQKADLTDKAILAQLLAALPRKALSQPRSRAESQSALDADIERLCRDLGDEVADVPAQDRHPAPAAAVRANESATHNVPMLAVPTLRREPSGVVKAPDKTPKGSSFRDRLNARNKAGFAQSEEEEEEKKIERLKQLNAELCALQEKLILTPRKERKEVKKDAEYIEKKIEQWSGDWSGKIQFADDAVVYDRPANARCLQPLTRGTAEEVSECGATLSGQGTFNSPEDFARWLATSGATALKSPDSPSNKKKRELRETEEAEKAESPKSYTDQALAGGKTFASPEEFAEWMRMTKLSDTGGDTPSAVPSPTTRHGNALSPLTEDQDARQSTFPRLAPPPPPTAVQSHFNPLTPRLMVPDPQLAQQRCAAPPKSAPRQPPRPPAEAWSPSPPLAPSTPASTNIGFNALCTPRMGAETSFADQI